MKSDLPIKQSRPSASRRRSSLLAVQRSEKPFFLINFIASKPCLSIGIVLSLTIILSFIAISKQYNSGAPLISTPRSDADLDHPSAINSHSLLVARDQMYLQKKVNNSNETMEQQTKSGAQLFLTFEGKEKKNLLDTKRLKKLRDIERKIVNHTEYPDYCLRQPSKNLECDKNYTKAEKCAPIYSPLSIFYASNLNMTEVKKMTNILKTKDYSEKSMTMLRCMSSQIPNLVKQLVKLELTDRKNGSSYNIDNAIQDAKNYVQKVNSTRLPGFTMFYTNLMKTYIKSEANKALQTPQSQSTPTCKKKIPPNPLIKTLKTYGFLDLLFDFACEGIRKFNWKDKNNILYLFENFQNELLDRIDGKGDDLVEDIDAVIELLKVLYKEIPSMKSMVDLFFEKQFVSTSKSRFTRIIIPFGLPLEGFKNSDINKTAQVGNFTKWFKSEFKEYFETEQNKDIDTLYFLTSLAEEEITNILQSDSMLAIASLAFVYGYLTFQTGSFFLASMGMTEIILSLPLAYAVYIFLGFSFLSVFCPMCIYIIAAIGADDIFVFMDAYRASAFEGPSVLASFPNRLSWVYRRAAGAMLITSLTTMVAFIATAISPLTTVKSFGIYSAFVILADYILVITFFPACVAFYHNRIEGKGCIPCCGKSNQTPTEKLRQGIIIPQHRRVEKFLNDVFSPFIIKFKYLILLVFTGLAIVNIILASKVSATTEEDQFLPKSHPFQRSIDITNTFFFSSSQDSYAEMTFYWGLDGIDRKDVNLLTNATYLGSPKYSSGFKLDKKAQEWLHKFCDKLSNNVSLVSRVEGAFQGGINPGAKECFIDDFKSFIERKPGVEFPVPEANVTTYLKQFLNDKENKNKYESSIGFVDDKLKFIAVKFKTTVDKYRRYSQEELVELYQTYNDYLETEMQSAPSSLPKGAQTIERRLWVRMRSQAIYVQSAINGAVAGTLLAFVVILIATQYFRIALFASLSIGGVLVCVLGFMNIVGWPLGTIEAINITILAGFSVDYVVHLAHAFNVSLATSREERVKEAFKEIGISVFSGMITSIGASVILFFCQLQFFAKFGAFLCLTIGYSYLWSNFFFMSLLAAFGPNDNFIPDSKIGKYFPIGF